MKIYIKMRDAINMLNRIVAHRRFVPVCLFLGIVIRLVWIWWVDAEQVIDFMWYQQFARNIADGRGYSVNGIPTGYWPIGYPGLLGIIFYVTGDSVFVGKFLNIVLYIGAIFLTYRLSQRLFHQEYAARVTVCLLCFYPNHIAYTALLSSEILFIFLVALSALTFETARDRAGFLMLSGMFWGLTALTKPQALVLPFVFLLFFSKSVSSFVRSGILVYSIVLITVSPWLIRNHNIFGAYTLAHTAGIDLLDGNNPYNDTGHHQFNEKVNALLGDLQAQIVPFENPFDGKEVERDTRARKIAFHYMIDNPGRVLALLPKKFLALYRFDNEGFILSMGMMPSMMPSPEGSTRTLYKNVLQFSQRYYDFLIVLFVISLPMVVKFPLRPQHIGLAIIVSLTLVYLMVFGEPRYHFSMMPWVAIYSGLGAQALLLGKGSLLQHQDQAVRAFDAGAGRDGEAAHELDVEKLHAKIGQLTVERDFLARRSGR
jgi:hypothetical protein